MDFTGALVSTNTSRNPSAQSRSCEGGAPKETFSINTIRLTFIDTAEDNSQWAARAKRQWGNGAPISVRVNSKSTQRGLTPARPITFGTQWTGVTWTEDDVDVEVPLLEDPVLLLEVVSERGSNGVAHGIAVLNAQAMIAEGRQYAKYCIHFIPTKAAIDSLTVYAVAEVEIHSSLLDEPPENNFTPLEYNYGSVRVSTIDFYYPPFLLTATGQYIVSNVICAMNMTESSSLAMQLLPLKTAESYIVPEPSSVITVRPQQRVYFSATWVLTQGPCMKPLEMQLTVNGSQQASAPIIIKVHNAVPQPTTTDLPYQYWVNTTRITNRQMLLSQELPLIRAILPVHRFISNSPIDQSEGIIVAFDKDKGEQVLVRANGMPVTMGRSSNSVAAVVSGQSTHRDWNTAVNTLADGGLDFNVGDFFPHDTMLDSNASFIVRDPSRSNALPSRGPLLNLSQKTCMCTIVLGTIRGFPMVYETSTGVSPSFQVSITLLDQKGWQVVQGETLPSYQSASGSLRWAQQLVLRKWPGAESTEFLRLNLTEVRPRDGDETPIGAGLISLSSMDRIYAFTQLSVAFYVYETYSLYDQLNSPSLLMKDVSVIFSEMR